MKMPDQPKINIEPARIDQILEILGWAVLLLLWILAIYDRSRLSGDVAINFKSAGWGDNSGSRSALLVLPLTGTFLLLAMTVLNRFPHVFNYPVPITAENAPAQYTTATRMLRLMKIAVAAVFTAINRSIFNGAGAGVWFLPLILVIFTALAVYFVNQPVKAGKVLSLVRAINAKVHKSK